ncbi:hypothetical protein LRB90_05340 [Borreliella burgdorferi]|nr:hypothetical protein [Borreliella burgdorferi]MCD2412400.1 hypothetical protein [Borreliella burgdorferi]
MPFKFANRYNENLKKTRHWACRF